MIKMNLDELMEQQGINNLSALSRTLEMSRHALRAHIKSDIQRIELENIEGMCRTFDVTPNGLFKITNEDGSEWKPNGLRSTDNKKVSIDKLQKAASKIDDEIAKQEALKLGTEKSAAKKAIDQTIEGLNLAKSIIKAIDLGLME